MTIHKFWVIWTIFPIYFRYTHTVSYNSLVNSKWWLVIWPPLYFQAIQPFFHAVQSEHIARSLVRDSPMTVVRTLWRAAHRRPMYAVTSTTARWRLPSYLWSRSSIYTSYTYAQPMIDEYRDISTPDISSIAHAVWFLFISSPFPLCGTEWASDDVAMYTLYNLVGRSELHHKMCHSRMLG